MTDLLERLRPHMKAIVAFATPAILQLVADYQGGISVREIVRNLGVSLLTAVTVWAKANHPSDATQEFNAV